VCDNGLDEDNDGLVDFSSLPGSDPGCSGPADTSERCPTGGSCAACDDGFDNDADSRTDFRLDGGGDFQCTGPTDTSETTSAFWSVTQPLPLPQLVSPAWRYDARRH
jgi:hypothetical protein